MKVRVRNHKRINEKYGDDLVSVDDLQNIIKLLQSFSGEMIANGVDAFQPDPLPTNKFGNTVLHLSAGYVDLEHYKDYIEDSYIDEHTISFEWAEDGSTAQVRRAVRKMFGDNAKISMEPSPNGWPLVTVVASEQAILKGLTQYFDDEEEAREYMDDFMTV